MYIEHNFADSNSEEQKSLILDKFENVQIRNRDRLLSSLLQDRSALRLISAPNGFGKSMLAYEYMQRLFASMNTIWIDARSPEFLRNLDSSCLIPSELQQKTPHLLVIDDIPYLDEERANTLADHINLCLYKDIEVIVTCTPSHDCLRSRIPDRILINSVDLLVSEGECKTESRKRSAGNNINNVWEQQKRILFGLTPLAVWNHTGNVSQKCLSNFFNENLPIDFFRSIFCMLLIGNGHLKDLSKIGVPLHPENEIMLIKDYSFIDIDPIQHNFSCRHFSLDDLQNAIEDAHLIDTLINGSFPLPEKVLSYLIEHGNNDRAEKILNCFCSDEQCAQWLSEKGWSLLDREEITLINKLFSRCDHFDIEDDMNLLSMYAWFSGLQGNKYEATHCAESVLCKESAEDKTSTTESTPAVMAYLALLAFGDGGAAIFKKPNFKPKTLVTPQDYLAAIVDEFKEQEILQALNLNAEESTPCERITISAQREQRIETLITKGSENFLDNHFIRLALHFIRSTDSVELRRLLQNIGYKIVIKARRESINTNTEALIIADLWRGGFFGITKKGEDYKDARILDEAASMLNRLSMFATGQAFNIPWEDNKPNRKAVSDKKEETNKAEKIILNDAEAQSIYVRLLGGFDIIIGGKTTSENHWRKKSRLLFTILVLGQGRDITREFIFEQLWPSISRERATDNFYSVWSNVEKSLDSKPYILRTGQFCKIDQRLVKSDIAEFESASRRLLVERENSNALLDLFSKVESLYRGPLAPFETKNPYVLKQRARFRSIYTDAMISASDHALEIGDPRIGLWFARKAMEEENTREDVFFSLIRAQIANGQRCSAIRTFFQCKEYLREELGLDPSSETNELYQQLISIDPSLLKLTPKTFKR